MLSPPESLDGYVGLPRWRSASDELKAAARVCLSEIVDAHRDELVQAFYGALMRHRDGTAFLDHAVVEERLSHSLGVWMRDLVTADLDRDLNGFKSLQARIGAVHARIKVPNHLVMQGASLLKSRIGALVADHDLTPEVAKATIIMLGELFDYAINLMSEAYVTDTRDRAKAEEAFRLYNLGQDINLERETQRAALMEWSQQILFGLLGNQQPSNRSPLSSSPFGLWLRHRASMLFPDSVLIDRMDALIQRIDEECLPAVVDDSAALGALQLRIEEIKYLLADLFQSAAAIENGRDPLTRTLNRRFLPSVLTREVALANESGLQLSVALFDVDHFKRVNDEFGHSVGDRVLGHVADALLRAVRSSDFVFRYGGEEFLAVFPETSLAEASRIAESLRAELCDRPVAIPDRAPIGVTISVGVAQFEGHPDYDYLLRHADEALYQAKHAGRNQVIAAPRAKAA